MLPEEVTTDMLLNARLITKAATKPKACRYSEARRLDALETATFRFLKNITDNQRVKAAMGLEKEYAQWFEVFNGIPMLEDEADYMGCDSFAYSNRIIQAVSQWKSRAKMAASRKGQLALALAACTDARLRRMYRIRLQTPDWVDYDKIKEIYALRDKITLETGVIHHVDHIVPLAGRAAKGFHVHSNMQILTAEENIRKSAGFQAWAVDQE